MPSETRKTAHLRNKPLDQTVHMTNGSETVVVRSDWLDLLSLDPSLLEGRGHCREHPHDGCVGLYKG